MRTTQTKIRSTSIQSKLRAIGSERIKPRFRRIQILPPTPVNQSAPGITYTISIAELGEIGCAGRRARQKRDVLSFQRQSLALLPGPRCASCLDLAGDFGDNTITFDHRRDLSL